MFGNIMSLLICLIVLSSYGLSTFALGPYPIRYPLPIPQIFGMHVVSRSSQYPIGLSGALGAPGASPVLLRGTPVIVPQVYITDQNVNVPRRELNHEGVKLLPTHSPMFSMGHLEASTTKLPQQQQMFLGKIAKQVGIWNVPLNVKYTSLQSRGIRVVPAMVVPAHQNFIKSGQNGLLVRPLINSHVVTEGIHGVAHQTNQLAAGTLGNFQGNLIHQIPPTAVDWNQGAQIKSEKSAHQEKEEASSRLRRMLDSFNKK